MTHRLGFIVQPRSRLGGALEVVPVIDKQELVEIVEEYERSTGVSASADGHGGLVPSFYRFGPLDAHFLGQGPIVEEGKVPLLGCGCGEWGCDPILAKVVEENGQVTWTDLSNSSQAFPGLGPFIFDAQQYRDALRELTERLARP